MKTIRIFISSPGDVTEERERAKRVIEGLRRRYAQRFHLKPMLWEDLALQADASFQTGIDRVLLEGEGIDVAIFILWSRMGQLQDGGKHRSGTEREFDLMRAAREQSPEGQKCPALFVYTREDDASFEERLRGKTESQVSELLEQKGTVEQFITETFQDAETGRSLRAYHRFDRPSTFSQRLRTHLLEHLDELAGGISVEVWNIETQGPPFLGLETFQSHHADVFFGREEEILEARHSLREAAGRGGSFLLLSGASGSGKSSLARAGILPEIVANEVDEQIAAWRVVVATPDEWRNDLVGSLVASLASDEVLPGLRAQGGALCDLVDAMNCDPDLAVKLSLLPAFEEASQKLRGGVRLLLLLDQFEQLFTLPAITEEARDSFLAAIRALCRSGRVWVVATIRSDSEPLAGESEPFARLVGEGARLHVRSPSADAISRLIAEPAWVAGLSFECRDGISLADRILKDSANQPELLPLISFVLRELFEQRTEDGLLCWSVYEALGGVEGALSRRAERTYADLPWSGKRAFDSVFKRLVCIPSQGDGAATSDTTTSRPVKQRVARAAFVGDPGAETFVAAFIETRLFTADSSGSEGEASVSVAHESLFRAWPRANAWIADNEQFLKSREQLRSDFRAWVASGRRGEFLLPKGRRLSSARKFAKEARGVVTEEERSFIRASVRRNRSTSAGFWFGVTGGALLLMALLFSAMLGVSGYLMLVQAGMPAERIQKDASRFLGFWWRYDHGQFTDEDLTYVSTALEDALATELPDSARMFDLLTSVMLVEAYTRLGRSFDPSSNLWGTLDSVDLTGGMRYLSGSSEMAVALASRYCQLAIWSGNDEVADRSFSKMIEWANNAKERGGETESLVGHLMSSAWALVRHKASSGKIDEAWSDAGTALECAYGDSRVTERWHNQAVFALLCGRTAEAIEAVETALREDPEDKDSVMMAFCIDAEMANTESLERWRERITSHPDIDGRVIMSAALHFSSRFGFHRAAQALIETAGLQVSTDAVSLIRRGWAGFHLGDFREALAAFDLAVELNRGQGNPLSASLIAGRAACLWQLGESEEAKKSYRELIDLDKRWRGPTALFEKDWHPEEARVVEEIRESVREDDLIDGTPR